MNYIKLIFVALIFISFLIAVFQNENIFVQEHKIQFDLWIYQFPVYYVKNYALLAVAFGFGVILSIIMGIFNSSKRKSQIKNDRRRIKELEKEISDVRMAGSSSFSPSGNQSEKSPNSPFIPQGS